MCSRYRGVPGAGTTRGAATLRAFKPGDLEVLPELVRGGRGGCGATTRWPRGVSRGGGCDATARWPRGVPGARDAALGAACAAWRSVHRGDAAADKGFRTPTARSLSRTALSKLRIGGSLWAEPPADVAARRSGDPLPRGGGGTSRQADTLDCGTRLRACMDSGIRPGAAAAAAASPYHHAAPGGAQLGEALHRSPGLLLRQLHLDSFAYCLPMSSRSRRRGLARCGVAVYR